MHARVMKWLSVAALLPTVLFRKAAKHFWLERDLAVGAAAAVVVAQAFEAKKYYLVPGLFAIALTFNPLLPVFRPAGNTALSIVVFSIVSFVMALVQFRPLPLISMPPVTGRNPGSRPL